RNRHKHIGAETLLGEPAALVVGDAAEEIVFAKALRDAIFDHVGTQHVADVRRELRIEPFLKLKERIAVHVTDLRSLRLAVGAQHVKREPAPLERTPREPLIERLLTGPLHEGALLADGLPALAVQSKQRVERRLELVFRPNLTNIRSRHAERSP